MMAPFPQTHEHQLEAADGWLGLGDWESAQAELDKLPPLLGAHPRVLALRARIYASANKWSIAEQIGAKVLLTPVVDPELLLALAKCACALGKPRVGRRRLALAFELNDNPEFKVRAFDDPALTEAWATNDL